MRMINIEIPDSLHRTVDSTYRQEGMSFEQFVTLAMAEKAAAIATETYLAERAERGDQARFLAAMAKVPDVDPPDERDRI